MTCNNNNLWWSEENRNMEKNNKPEPGSYVLRIIWLGHMERKETDRVTHMVLIGKPVLTKLKGTGEWKTLQEIIKRDYRPMEKSTKHRFFGY